MSQRPTPWQALRSTAWKDWRDSGGLLVYTLGGGLAPLWIGWATLKAYSQTPTFVDFAKGGEFALYSAALMAPTLYLIAHDRERAPFAARPMYLFVAGSMLLVSVCAYALIAPVITNVVKFEKLDVVLIATTTIWLFLACVLLTLLVTALDNARTVPLVDKISAQQQARLENDFDKL